MNKLRGKQGETLAETLVSILIIALATLLLTTMVGSAVRIDGAADRVSAQLFEELDIAEERGGSRDGGVVLAGGLAAADLDTGRSHLAVTFSGEADSLTCYRRKAAAP